MAHVSGVFHDSLTKSISDSKILMVGAGGIGCELLKNIVLTGLVFMCFLFVIRLLIDVLPQTVKPLNLPIIFLKYIRLTT